MSRAGKLAVAVLAAASVLLATWALWAWPREQRVASASPADYAATAANLARGAYLARAGNCMSCHTARGGAPYAGGRTVHTPFGAIAAPNITPDPDTGIGTWSADDFWRALHNGISRDGRLLYPAFPYPSYSKVSRPDADALYAWLRTVPAQRQASAAPQLRFPYNTQAALAAWRLLYFRPAVFVPTAAASVQWNRGAYLVEGLGHCAACHAARNAAGASDAAMGGALMPVIGWYAPSLTADAEAGLGNWSVPDIALLLKTGTSPRASVVGPMADVVAHSLQHLDDTDLAAMAVYLKALPAAQAAIVKKPEKTEKTAQLAQFIEQGRDVYGRHCIDCHGANGEGLAPAYPPLAGNRALTMDVAVNPIRIVLNGGFPPGTAGNPRPYGMPPFSHVLDDAEVAAVLSYLRASWGNQAAPVSAREVNRYRGAPVD
jgi:mono/diheme cytochrome c family protein